MADGVDQSLTDASPYIAGAGTFFKAFGGYEQGQALAEHGVVTNAAAQFAAAQMRQNANAVAASSQRSAIAIGRQGQYVQSAQLARAAASGGGAQDPTIMNIIARTHAETSLRQQTALYGGQAQERQMLVGAEAEDWSGAEAQRVGARAASAADFGAAATLASGGVSLYEKYGRHSKTGAANQDFSD